MRRLLAFFMTAVVLTFGCASYSVPEGALPEVRYYAAVADYNSAKRVAVAYAESPRTPVEHVYRIIEVVELADAELKAFEESRAALGGDAEYSSITLVLATAVRQLSTYAVKEDS